MVVDDAEAVRSALLEQGIAASEVDPQPWGRFLYFTDPDGNGWALQEMPEGS